MHGLFKQTNTGFIFAKVLFVLLFVVSAARAEKLPFKSYTTSEGLAHDRVNEIVRDSRGFLWFCTGEGISRFDGYEFKNYTQAHGLPHRSVNDLLETGDGTYLVATDDGLAIFNPLGVVPRKNDSQLTETPMFRTLRSAERDADGKPFGVVDIHKSRDGQIYATTYGAFYRIVRESSEQWRFEKIESEQWRGKTIEFTYLAEDGFGAIWISSPSGLFRFQPESGEVVMGIEKAAVTSLLADSQGRFWAARNDSKPGLYLYDLANGQSQPVLKRHFTTKDGLNQNEWINHLIETSDGRILAGTPKGLCEYLPGSEPAFKVLVPAIDIVSLIEDGDGNVWIGSSSLGAVKLTRSGFVIYDAKDGIPEMTMGSIIAGDAGEISVTSGTADLLRFDGEKFTAVKPLGMPPRSWGWNQLELRSRIDGEWWFPTSQGLLRYPKVGRVEDLSHTNPSKIYTKDNSGLFTNDMFRLFEDSRGDIWMSFLGNENTLMRWERSSEKFYGYTAADNLPINNAPTAFGEDAAGNIWIGYYGGGIARYRDGKFSFYSQKENFPSGFVSAIYNDRGGRLWIGISNSGLVRVDNLIEDEPRFVNLTVADGLSSNQANCLTEDNFGRVYVGTGRGISRIEPDTGRIKIYSKADGLPHSSVRTCGRDSEGNLWFVQKFNLVRFAPEADSQAKPPPIFIGDLRVNGEAVRKLSELGETAVENLELAADERQIQIDFFALGFGTGETLRYQYRLEGGRGEWSEPSALRTINLNLSPGSYNFKVRAVNAEGVASENPATVSFTILRPVWQRWWFLLLAAVAISAAIYALYRYRVQQIIELERVRTRIATDLHDDIGSSLSKIAILSEVVRRKNGIAAKGADNKNEPLEIIADTSREMVDSMSDIVWAINPERDSLSDLIHRMRRFAEDILDAQDIGYQFIVPEHLRDIALGADVRRNVYLIFKECVNNLAKHAEATEAEIKINLENEKLIVEIKDDGRGFVAPQTSATANVNNGGSNGFGGNGLRNIRRRAENFGGAFSIDSKIGEGTRIVLQIPLNKKLFAF